MPPPIWGGSSSNLGRFEKSISCKYILTWASHNLPKSEEALFLGLAACRGTDSREILARNRLFKPPQNEGGTSPNRKRLCLAAWKANFSYFHNHFLKIHVQQIPKMSDFLVLGHSWPRKWLSKLNKRVLDASFSHLTFQSQMGTLSSQCLGDPSDNLDS